MQGRDGSILIKNIYVYDSHSSTCQLKNVLIKDGQRKIFDCCVDTTSLEITVDKNIDAKGEYTLIPEGMLDSHVHGQGGPDFADVGKAPEKIPIITRALGETGLSYVMATLVSLELNTLKQCLLEIEKYIQSESDHPTPGACKIVGIHLEGPFIAKSCKGAHQIEALHADIDIEKFKDIIATAPTIKEWKITLAPDLPGAIDFIRMTKNLEVDGISVKVFIGHTNPSDKDVVNQAIQAGAAGFTHLGNACQETCSRLLRELEPKDAVSHVVQWVLEHPDQCPPGVELIVDGVHLSKSFVKMVKEKIGDKIVLVTDALGPSGLPDGPGSDDGYKLGALPIYKEKTNFYLRDHNGSILLKEGTLSNGESGLVPSLAGSAASLPFCVKTYFDWITKQEETLENRIKHIYKAAIENPKISSLSKAAMDHLPEDRNLTIFDKHDCLVASLCNGSYMTHSVLELEFDKKPSILSPLHLFSHKEITSEKASLQAGNPSSPMHKSTY